LRSEVLRKQPLLRNTEVSTCRITKNSNTTLRNVAQFFFVTLSIGSNTGDSIAVVVNIGVV
jgi:hypothetical protein